MAGMNVWEVIDMKKSIIIGIAAMSLAFLFTANDSFAYRDATSYEEAAVYGALRSQGCTVTDDVEVESFVAVNRYGEPRDTMPGVYKTEAICSDGEKYDVKLDSQLNILTMKLD
ncbi:MAG TPA: hypothetical protein VFJ67_01530 [Thermodesulfobacteriota bacterium]|nr:hypothetical protein [Thermodesulfobacteriota bacterium]